MILDVNGKLATAASFEAGDKLTVRFEDDPGWWHERVVLYRGGGHDVVILTPGGDVYIEDWAEDWQKYLPIGRDGDYHESVVGNVVVFTQAIGVAEFQDLVREGMELVSDKATADGTAVPTPCQVVKWMGASVDVPRVGLGSRLRRRLWGKKIRELPVKPKPVMRSVSLAPDDGFVWVVSEGGVGVPLGAEVDLGPSSARAGGEALYVGTDGRVFSAVMIKRDDLVGFRARRIEELTTLLAGLKGDADTPRDAKPASGADAPVDLRKRLELGGADKLDGGGKDGAPGAKDVVAESSGDDLRTLWIDTDKYGRRFKAWRDVLAESSTTAHGVAEYSGPPVVEPLMEYFHSWGGDPRLWMREWRTELELKASDRTMHEVTVIVDAFHYGGTVDQVNMPRILAFEVLGRRLITIIDAYAFDGARPL